MADEFEALLANEMLDVAARAGEEIVDTDYFRALRQQAVAQMGAEEAGAAGHHDALLKMHNSNPAQGDGAAMSREVSARGERRDDGTAFHSSYPHLSRGIHAFGPCSKADPDNL
jgi:hypothetical protein